jgi:hypothetical protein
MKINETFLVAIIGTIIFLLLIFIYSDKISTFNYEKATDELRKELNSAEDKHQLAIESQDKKVYEDYCQALLDVVSNGNKIIKKYHTISNYKPELVGVWKGLAKTIYSERCNVTKSYGLYNDGLDWRNWDKITLEDLYNEEDLNENPNPDSVSQLCDNYEDLEVFEEPIPIVWEARLDGCLVSCMGASFTRMPESDQYQHSRFSGNYKDNWDDNGEYTGEHIIEEEFRKDNITLRIYGDWIGVDYAYVDTVFGGKCVPDIDIDKIEIVE